METQLLNPHERSPERDRLRACERSRRSARGRDFYWDSERWADLLTELIDRERRSDDRFQREIADRRPGGAGQRALEEQFESCITSDIAWYKEFLRDLTALRVSWDGRGLTSTPDYDDLCEHQARIELRLLEREAVLQQLALDILERRRAAYGYLGRIDWQHYWSLLQGAWEQEREYYERVRGYGVPALVLQRRLDWLYRLRDAQRATEQAWSHHENFDWRDYQQAVTSVDAAIDALLPPAVPETGGVGAMLAALLVVVVLIGAIGGLAGAGKPSAPPPPTEEPGLSTPDARNAHDEGLALLQAGRCEEAILAFDRAYVADPNWYLPLNDKAFCLYELDQVDLAMSAWMLALDRNPHSPDAHAGLAMALSQRGLVDEAQQHYAQAVSLNAGYRDPAWMRTHRHWSERAIADSDTVRASLPAAQPTALPPNQ